MPCYKQQAQTSDRGASGLPRPCWPSPKNTTSRSAKPSKKRGKRHAKHIVTSRKTLLETALAGLRPLQASLLGPGLRPKPVHSLDTAGGFVEFSMFLNPTLQHATSATISYLRFHREELSCRIVAFRPNRVKLRGTPPQQSPDVLVGLLQSTQAHETRLGQGAGKSLETYSCRLNDNTDVTITTDAVCVKCWKDLQSNNVSNSQGR